MGKIIKSGKVVVMLAGRYAGRKAIVVKTFDEGNNDRKFGHCLVAGIDRYPRRITRSMSKKKIAKRSKIKPFVKFVNYNHVMPTRYVVDIDVKKLVEEELVREPEKRVELRKQVKGVFEKDYNSQTKRKEKWTSKSERLCCKAVYQTDRLTRRQLSICSAA